MLCRLASWLPVLRDPGKRHWGYKGHPLVGLLAPKTVKACPFKPLTFGHGVAELALESGQAQRFAAFGANKALDSLARQGRQMTGGVLTLPSFPSTKVANTARQLGHLPPLGGLAISLL